MKVNLAVDVDALDICDIEKYLTGKGLKNEGSFRLFGGNDNDPVVIMVPLNIHSPEFGIRLEAMLGDLATMFGTDTFTVYKEIVEFSGKPVDSGPIKQFDKIGVPFKTPPIGRKM